MVFRLKRFDPLNYRNTIIFVLNYNSKRTKINKKFNLKTIILHVPKIVLRVSVSAIY